VASITKEFTGACILLLAEDGKLSIHDPVAKYFPNLTRAQDVQVLDLMNKVSGYREVALTRIPQNRTKVTPGSGCHE
jgi:CubicO group peptidase (beta-lactamase class C family)